MLFILMLSCCPVFARYFPLIFHFGVIGSQCSPLRGSCLQKTLLQSKRQPCALSSFSTNGQRGTYFCPDASFFEHFIQLEKARPPWNLIKTLQSARMHHIIGINKMKNQPLQQTLGNASNHRERLSSGFSWRKIGQQGNRSEQVFKSQEIKQSFGELQFLIGLN